MSGKQELKWNIEEVTDAEVYSAIRYLDRKLPETERSDDSRSGTGDVVLTVCTLLVVLLVAFSGYVWLYFKPM